MTELTPREEQVFRSVVRNFVQNARPVGSRLVAKQCGMDVSAATIRNVMADLEEKGLITHPHTSAGRVPTDRGYRYYVDTLMQVDDLTPQEREDIRRKLLCPSADVEQILESSSRALGNISKLLGVVLAPRFYQGIFDRLDLVEIADKRILVIIRVKSGLVKTILMEIDSNLSRERLEETARVLNERLHGLTLLEIKRTIDKRMADISEGSPDLVRLIVGSAESVFDIEGGAHFYVSGTGNILSQPEFISHEQMSKILQLLDQKHVLIQVLNEQGEKEGVSIIIGEENREELMRSCSLITATYNLGDVTGTLGVLGPTRMQYAKVIALVDYMAQVLHELIRERQVI
ncbi:MAG: heat-inducible transcriptional repressor HrcA [bacterium]|jgi:heat-inducible transcriptional repressor|nr:heat-inducible transcriptional repressor HrcA [candidate division KSB1 bacterium]MDH7561175.1 heat-inducible transcriptional repressor HrcA [bacterium]